MWDSATVMMLVKDSITPLSTSKREDSTNLAIKGAAAIVRQRTG